MKCPECDLEQPDHTPVCGKCGLNFALWRIHAGETPAAKSVPEEEPLPDEGEGAPSKEEEPPPPATEEEVSAPKEQKPEEKSLTPANDETAPEKTKGTRNLTFYWVGLGILILIMLAVLLTHRTPSTTPPNTTVPIDLNSPPTVQATASTSITPGETTPGMTTPGATPQANVTPETNLSAPTPQAQVPTAITESPAKHPTHAPKPDNSEPAVKGEPTNTPAPPAETPVDSSSAPTPQTSSESPSADKETNADSPKEAAPTPTSLPKDLLESSEPAANSITPTVQPTPATQ